LHVSAAVTYVTCLKNKSAGQFSLKANFPSLIVGCLGMLVEERYRVTNVRLRPCRCSRRAQNSIRELSGQSRTENNVAVFLQVISRLEKIRFDAIASLDYVAATFAEETIEHSVAGAENCFIVDSESEADPGHEIMLGCVVQPAIVG